MTKPEHLHLLERWMKSYVRLALREEREALAQFGAEYERYAARTPRFVPRLRGTQTAAQG